MRGWGVWRHELCVCVCLGRIWAVGHARLWGRQLLLSWWISWHMQAMNYQATRVNYPKGEGKKKKKSDPALVAPGSLFQFREWFSQNIEGKRSSLEGARVGWWGAGKKKKREWMKLQYMCIPIPHSSPFFLHRSLAPRSNPEGKAQCENAKGYYQAFRVHKCHLWWMSVGFKKASCQTQAVSPPSWPSLFPHLSLVSKPYQAPGWNMPKCKSFVIYWSGCTHMLTVSPAVFALLVSNLFWRGERKKRKECLWFITFLRTRGKV